MDKFMAFTLAFILSVITVLADYFIKKASLQENIYNLNLLLGSLIYGLTAFGWVFIMKYIKLSTLGVIYGVSCISILTLVGVFVFDEQISKIEICGILMGIISIIILYRFG